MQDLPKGLQGLRIQLLGAEPRLGCPVCEAVDASQEVADPLGSIPLGFQPTHEPIELGTGRPHTSLSTLTLSLTQPLLRGGGWAVTLEPLTQAERTLVYAVRSYARFRENFYVYIAGGADHVGLGAAPPEA